MILEIYNEIPTDYSSFEKTVIYGKKLEQIIEDQKNQLQEIELLIQEKDRKLQELELLIQEKDRKLQELELLIQEKDRQLQDKYVEIKRLKNIIHIFN